MIETSALPQVALACLDKDHHDIADMLNQLAAHVKAYLDQTFCPWLLEHIAGKGGS